MKRLRVVCTAGLLLIFGATIFGYAQQEQQSEKQSKPEKQAQPEQQHAQQQQDQNKQHAQQQQQDQNKQHTQQQQQDQNKQHTQQQQRAQPEQQHAQQQQRAQPEQQHAQQQQRAQPEQQHAQQQQQVQNKQHAQVQRTQQQQVAQQGEQRGDWQQSRAHNFDSEHRTWQQRGGYNGYRISDDYYRSNYGQDHFFRVYNLPFMEVGGFPRFQYGGYWFSFVEPYPEFWGDDWYQTDDVYVAYTDDGYYLFNRRYSDRPGVAINISI